MTHNMRLLKYPLLLLCSLIIQSSIYGSEEFIHQKFGTRPFAMGGAYTSLAEGPERIFYNVAKESERPGSFFKLEYSSVDDVPVYVFSKQDLFKNPNLGLGYVYTSESDIPLTSLNSNNQPVDSGETFSNDIHGLFLSWRRSFALIDAGIRTHLFRESLQDDVGTGLGLDANFYKDFSIFAHPYSFGAAFKNILHSGVSWSTGHSDTVPIISTLGTSTSLFNNRLTVAFDIEKEGDYNFDSYMGTEYWVTGSPKHNGSIVIRAGSHRSDLTLGLGFISEGLIFDYAYRKPSLSFLDEDHRFSIGFTSFQMINSNPPKEKIEKSEKHHFPTSEITYERKKRQTKTPSLLMVGKLIYLPNQPPFIKFEENETSFSLTTTAGSAMLKNDTAYALSYPMTITGYLPEENQRISLTLEKNSTNHLIISGTLPSEFYIFIDGTIIKPNQANDIFFKTQLSKIQTDQLFEFLIFKNQLNIPQ
jgi:hypothetical protein